MGSLKYVDEAAALAKHGDEAMDAAKSLRRTAEAADAVADTAKQADNLMDVKGEAVKKALDAADNVGYSKISMLTTTQNLTMSRKSLTHLMVDISENGIQEPIKYVNIGDTYYVVDGHHRLYAAKKLGIKFVPVQEVSLPYKGYKSVDDLFWED